MIGPCWELTPYPWLCLVAILPQPGTWPTPSAMQAWDHDRLFSREAACSCSFFLSSVTWFSSFTSLLTFFLPFPSHHSVSASPLQQKLWNMNPPWFGHDCVVHSSQTGMFRGVLTILGFYGLWEEAGRWSEGRASSPVRGGQLDRKFIMATQKGPQTGLHTEFELEFWQVRAHMPPTTGVYRNTLWSLGVSETNQTGQILTEPGSHGIIRLNQVQTNENIYELENTLFRDLLGGPVVKYPSMLPLHGAWVWSLVGELRSCLPHGAP